MHIRILFLYLFLHGSIFPCLAQNRDLSQGNVFDGEPFLAINPNNSQHMAVAWMGYVPFAQISIKTKVSFNGGQLWSETVNIPHTNNLFGSADPSLAFDDSGNLFLTYIDYQALIDSGRVYVRKSIDGGMSWGAPVVAIDLHDDQTKKPIDRPWSSIDRSGGSNNGTIYITTMPPLTLGYIPPPYHPYMAISTDQGTTFNPWRHIDDTNWLAGSAIQGPMPTHDVGPDGTFHVVYPSWVPLQNVFPQYIHASSTDAGDNFDYHTVFASLETFSDSLAKKGYLLRADPSDPDHLSFIHLGVDHGDGDVIIRDSYDAGLSWTNGIRVNDDPVGNNRMQDLVWADFDSDGDMVVSWRDRRNGADSSYQTDTEIWGAVRFADSTEFSPNFPITDQLVAYDTILASNGNDFMCIQLQDDTLSAVWGDPRNGSLNIWFQRMSLDGSMISIENISTEQIPGIGVYPNPFRTDINIEGEDIERVTVYDQTGKLIFDKKITSDHGLSKLNLDHLPTGVHLLKVETKKGNWSEVIMKIE